MHSVVRSVERAGDLLSTGRGLQASVADVLRDLEGRVLIPGGEGLGDGELGTILGIMDEAEDLDPVAADVEPAEPLVGCGHTAALQEVVQEHQLILSPVEGEGWVQLLLHRRVGRCAVVERLVEGDDLVLGEGLLRRVEVGCAPGVEVGYSGIVLLLDDLGLGAYQ